VIKVKDLTNNILTKEDIVNYCDGKIAHYKIPRYIKFVTDYPLTVSGKVQKYIMRN
jgi:fatty-acyl-CoA synthase